MSIITDRLIIRDFCEDDLPALATILGDPTTMAFWPRPLAHDEAAAWLRRNMARREEGIYGRRALVLRASGALIGDAGVVRAELDGAERDDLGYIVRADHWGRGLATEAARALAGHYLHAHGRPALYANMAHDHRASQRVAERIGMRRVAAYHNTRNRDILTYLYALERA